jgi:hypothetical protein
MDEYKKNRKRKREEEEAARNVHLEQEAAKRLAESGEKNTNIRKTIQK